MSLILDALKKSEAERQLGRAPGLTTPMPLRRGETREPIRSWLRHAVWLAIVALAIAAGWWLTRATGREDAGADAPRSDSLAAAASSTGPDDAPPSAAAAVTAAPVDPDSAGRHGTVETMREATPPSLATAPATSPRAAQPPPRVVEPSAATPRDPEFDSVERETEAIVAPAAASAPSSPALPPPAVRLPAPPPVAAPDAATAVPANIEKPLETLPRLDQLGGPQRNALPPLKQTMHVYAEAPAARFVLIDGHRYVEGDQLSPSLQLLEIRRDGTVLQFDGLRFLLPRP